MKTLEIVGDTIVVVNDYKLHMQTDLRRRVRKVIGNTF